MKIVGNFAIICWDLLSNSDDGGRVGIKRLITRNQFVDNTTRGFESLPLRQIKGTLLVSVPFIWHSRSVTKPTRVASEGSHMRCAHICVARSAKLRFVVSGTYSTNFPRAAYHTPKQHSRRALIRFLNVSLIILFFKNISATLTTQL